MALEVRDFGMAIKLLQKGSKNLEDEYTFDFESAYYAYKYLKDYKLAEKYFKTASEKPNSPPFIKRMRAHMTYMSDNLDDAYNLWVDIYKNAKEKIEKDSAISHLSQIKYEKDKSFLEKIINLYKQKYGRYPMNLNELKRKELIREVPKDFRGNQYLYDNKTGKIKPKRIFKWKKLF